MSHRLPIPANPSLVVGAEVVTLVEVLGVSGKLAHPRGAVGVIVSSSSEGATYRMRFPDGFEALLQRGELVLLAHYKQGVIDQAFEAHAEYNLYDHVILRVVVGSRAFGLATEDSDTDRRGIYLAPAELQWSLYGVPEQIENEQTQEAYWELQKFLVMALKANPNVLECLYSPLIETELATLPDTDFAFHEQEYLRLCSQLQASFEQSTLPETPSAGSDLHDLLVRLRLGG